MSKNQDWGKRATEAIAHVKSGKQIKFANSEGDEFLVIAVLDRESGDKYLEITSLSKGIINTRPVEDHEIDNYINGLFNPKQRRLTGDTEPVLIGAEPKKRIKVVAIKKPNKPDPVQLCIQAIQEELRQKGLPRPARFSLFDIVKTRDDKVYIVIGVLYSLEFNGFMYRCTRSLNDPINDPTLFLDKEISHAKIK